MSSDVTPRKRLTLLGKRRRFPIGRRVPVRLLIPNLFTLMALAAGLTAIRMGIEQRFDLAIAWVLVAAVLDGLDGRIARLLKATSRFGAELDSLADFVNFGVAPALIMFIWALEDTRSLGWIVVLIYALCGALRLARFNVMSEQIDTEPRWKKSYFVGMPAPAAAITVMLPLYLAQLGVHGGEAVQPLILAHVLFVALMMVSRVPTFSIKMLGGNIDREFVAPLFIIATLLAALAFTYNWLMLVVGTLIYVALIPYGVYRYQRHRAQDEAEAKAMAGTETDPSGAPTTDLAAADAASDGAAAVAEHGPAPSSSVH